MYIKHNICTPELALHFIMNNFKFSNGVQNNDKKLKLEPICRQKIERTERKQDFHFLNSWVLKRASSLQSTLNTLSLICSQTFPNLQNLP